MTDVDTHDSPAGERLVASLLRNGTWLASSLIASGMVLFLIAPAASALWGHRLMEGGIVLFILLPVLRLAVLCALFLREHDRRHATIAALVLAIIAASVLISLLAPKLAPPA